MSEAEGAVEAQPEANGFWLGEDNKEYAEAKGWDSPEKAPEIFKSYREIEQMASGKVKIPDDDATWQKVLEDPDQVAQMKQRLNFPSAPDSVDGYDIQVDESLNGLRDGTTETALKQVALDAGIPADAFNKLVGAYYGTVGQGMADSFEQGTTALKDEWGDKYSENVQVAQRFTQNCTDDFKALLESSGLGNNPVFIKEFAQLGRKTLSDSLIKGGLTDPEDKGWKPKFADSPGMYANGDDADSKRARAYFEKRGHKY